MEGRYQETVDAKIYHFTAFFFTDLKPFSCQLQGWLYEQNVWYMHIQESS